MKTTQFQYRFLLASLWVALVMVLAACEETPEPEVNNQVSEDQDIPDLAPMPECPNNYGTPAERVYPAEGDVVLDLQPEFEWTFPFDCEPLGFKLKVGTILDPQSDDIFWGETVGLLRKFSGVQLLPATWHRWRVYTELSPGAFNVDPDPDFVSFVTGPTCAANQLAAPTLIYPADESVYTGKSWGNPYEVEADIGYPGGVCIPEGFTIYISETADFSTPNLNLFSPGTMFTPNPEGLLLIEDDSNDVPDCTTLYWHAWGTVGDTDGPMSETFSFYTNIEGTCPAKVSSLPTCEAKDLVAPTLVYPANGSTYTGKSWGNPYEVEADIGYPDGDCIPEGFTIYISETADFSTPNLNYFSPGAVFTSNAGSLLLIEDDSNDVPDCTNLYWRAWGMVGDTDGPVSETFSFFTNIEGTCDATPEPKGSSSQSAKGLSNAACREGGDSAYPEVDFLLKDEMAPIVGISEDGNYYLITGPNWGIDCWVWKELVETKGNLDDLAKVPYPPLPTATFTPLPPTIRPSPTPCTSSTSAGCP